MGFDSSSSFFSNRLTVPRYQLAESWYYSRIGSGEEWGAGLWVQGLELAGSIPQVELRFGCLAAFANLKLVYPEEELVLGGPMKIAAVVFVHRVVSGCPAPGSPLWPQPARPRHLSVIHPHHHLNLILAPSPRQFPSQYPSFLQLQLGEREPLFLARLDFGSGRGHLALLLSVP